MNDNNPVIISDLGGVIYSFDPNFDPEGHAAEFERIIRRYSGEDPRFADAFQRYREGDILPALKIESEAVARFLSPDASGDDSALSLYLNEAAIKNMTFNSQVAKIVIVATSLVETSRNILLSIPELADLVEGIDIYDMSKLGSKKDPESWRKIFKLYPRIDLIIEDGKENLKAAITAALSLGFKPNSSSSSVCFRLSEPEL